ncbi:AAA family ATPase [Stenotrophomonas maltophilia]|uniref:AAA family ATPase n=1 Tax=Stenotrophomonas maltophilia TaxID=40324 RepID=UPI000D0D52E2|nr:AAA family ATPase [Stenotrophomonas maltophilia]PSM13050.1 hypothetical protein CV100_14165 [Stenotrophomonas maltophilia]
MTTDSIRDQHTSVYFCSRRPSRGRDGELCIYISPSEDDWNDYGTQLRAVANVWSGKEFVHVPALIGFYGKDAKSANGRLRLKEITSKSSRAIPANEFDFFLMLPAMEHYRILVGSIGPKQSKSILMAARDLATWYHFKPSSTWIRVAMQDEAFSLSFMRDSEVHFALYNAGYVLRGLDQEVTARPATCWDLNFKISSSENEHSIRLRFDHSDFLPRRISVIIGKNGVGKSQSLRAIAKSLLQAAPGLVDSNGGRPRVSRLIAFSPSGEGTASFPAESEKYATWYRKFPIGRTSRQPQDRRASEVIVRLARSQATIAGATRLELFRSSLTAITGYEQLGLSVTSGLPILLRDLRGSTSIASLRTIARIDRSKAPVRVVDGAALPLSSGEASFVTFAAQLCDCIENGSLVLLDEPETHLHPNLISSFCSLLEKTLRATGSSAVIATHSAYFVREVFREQVTVINRTGNFTEIVKPRLRTFGADIGAISRFVFGEEDESRLAHQLMRQIVSHEADWDTVYTKYKDELSMELLGAIRDEMESKEVSE